MKEYSNLLSKRVMSLKPSGIRRFFDIAAEMGDVLSLSVGEPDFKTPARIRNAGIQSLNDGKTFYTANSGMTELREEIAKYLERRFRLTYDPNGEVIVTVGGSEAIDICFRALLDPGDEVLVPEPSFVCYGPIVTLCSGVPVPIVTEAKDRFKLTPEALKAAITPKTKMLVLPFPCNPTGGIMERADLEAIAEILRGTDIMVLSDEIYAELTYGKQHVSIAELPGMRERTIVVNGFSKAYAMTGWRLGYAVGPQPILSQMTKVHQFGIMSAPTTAQYAAIVALRECDDEIQKMVDEYNARRQYIVSEFNRIGLSCFEPEGAFYAFPSIQSTGLDSETFCERMIREQRVAVVPGNAFGDSGEGFIRVCYASSMDNIKTAISRMEAFLATL